MVIIIKTNYNKRKSNKYLKENREKCRLAT